MKRILITILLISPVLHVNIALAKLYKCKNMEGVLSFQEKRCEDNELEVKVEKYLDVSHERLNNKNNTTNSKRKSTYTSNTRKLYSDYPQYAELNPNCSIHNVCFCGSRHYRMTGKDNDLIANMKKLPGLWKQYDRISARFASNALNKEKILKMQTTQVIDSDAFSSVYAKNYNKMDRLACRIQVVQKRINNQFEKRKNYLVGEITLRNRVLSKKSTDNYKGDLAKENHKKIDELNSHAVKIGLGKIEY